jgi:lysozyme
MYLGIDVSNHNGHISWPIVAESGVDRAVIKASEAVDYHDEFYHFNIVQAQAAGLGTAAYHFGRPFANSGHAEAKFFLEVCAQSPAPQKYFLDLEDDRGSPIADLAAYAVDFLETVAVQTGTVPGLYTNTSYARAHRLLAGLELGAFDLWLAAWQSTFPVSFQPFREWAGWQFTPEGYSPGAGFVCQDLWREKWPTR